MTTVTTDEPTPNGGVRSTAFYCDEQMNERTIKEATRVVITEYDSDGGVVAETVAETGG